MEIESIAKLIEKSGGKLYLVGGAVRDSLLNRPIYDRDYCTVGLSKEEFLRIVSECKNKRKSL